jgi:ribosomal protein RSM22 (predicted rRNA methylase)
MLRLPEPLIRQLADEVDRVGTRTVTAAAATMSEAYRNGRPFVFRTEEECLAYAIARMPATFAALGQALARLTPKPHSLLDIGSGPGTASWACAHLFGELASTVLVERDSGLAALGRRLGAPCTQWIVRDLRQVNELPAKDLVVLGYSLGEFPPAEQIRVIERAWQAARQALLIVEPGTPAGFERIRQARERLLRECAYLAAPCPHAGPCPIQAPDWCHFSARVERTREHRLAKQAALGYEDEKYSFVLATRETMASHPACILRHPQKSKGLVELRLCTAGGIQSLKVSKSSPDWKRARKATWGDTWLTEF